MCLTAISVPKDTQHDLFSLASPKGEMTSSFSWTSFIKSPTSSTLCFCDPTLAKINQVISVSMCGTVLCVCNQPPNTKTWSCLYLQEEPSAPQSDESSGDSNETTNPDEFTHVHAHHTYRFQCNHKFT